MMVGNTPVKVSEIQVQPSYRAEPVEKIDRIESALVAVLQSLELIESTLSILVAK